MKTISLTARILEHTSQLYAGASRCRCGTAVVKSAVKVLGFQWAATELPTQISTPSTLQLPVAYAFSHAQAPSKLHITTGTHLIWGMGTFIEHDLLIPLDIVVSLQ